MRSAGLDVEQGGPEATDGLPGGPVGVIGLGLVGGAISGSMMELGHTVLGYDVVPEKRAALEAAGGATASSVSEVVTQCRVVFVCVLTSAQAAAALVGNDGLMSEKVLTEVVIDTTTADPEDSERTAERLRHRGIGYLDAPLSGSSAQIRARQAVFLVGGDRDTYNRVSGFLSTLARSQFYLGANGAGSKAKIASNLVLGLNRMALAEGLVFAERIGLDPTRFMDVLRDTPAYSRAIDAKGEKMLRGDFTPQSRIAQHRKDLDIILDYAKRFDQPLPLTAAHHDVLTRAEAGGLADADTCAVLEQLRRMRGRGTQ